MSNIDSDLIRGNIDTIILKTMVDGDKYGLDIIKEVETRSNGTYELKQPTLYSCLKRLENQELISSYWLDSDIGGKRHYYKLTEKGKETLQKKQEEWSKSKFIIDNLLSNFNYDEYRLVKKQDYDKIIEGKQFEYTSSPTQNAPTESQNLQNSGFETTEEVSEENYSDNSLTKETISETTADESLERESTETNSNETQFESTSINETPNETIENQSLNSVSQNVQNIEQSEKPSQNQTETQEQNFKLFEYQDAIQQNILDMDLEPKSNKIEKEIEEFSNAASRLNNFGTESSVQDETKMTQEPFEPAIHAEKIAEEITHLESAPEIRSNETNNFQNVQMPSQNENNFEETKTSEKVEEESFCLPSQKYNEPEPENQYETFDDDDEFLQELDELNAQNSNAYFSNFDETAYNETVINQKQTDYDFAPPQNFENEQIQTSSSVKESTLVEQTDELSQEAETTTFDYNNFDSIISESANNYIEENTSYKETHFESFRPSYTNENYKQKLSNLSAYSKISDEESEQIFEKTKDINALKEEFEKEGIAIKKYNKTFGETSAKNYLLINKLNLVKSLIILAGYVFVLSALYIILNNTSAREMYNFSIKYFLYGFIPFIVYALIYLVIYIANPYKKVPAKYSPRIMLFISVMVTVQLLLITYCVNLQLGFYSFSQTYYNHLFWIIPLVISFAPLVSNILHISLFYSKNFNV